MRTALACLLLCAGFAAHAQAPLTRSEQAFIDFGFANQLGSGVYTMSGRTLQGTAFRSVTNSITRPRRAFAQS